MERGIFVSVGGQRVFHAAAVHEAGATEMLDAAATFMEAPQTKNSS
ncbi:MAG: hypothetical protein U5N27_04385 [Rhizobium sp.]|nr:hypothetical protein [Rhizobium sp.]